MEKGKEEAWGHSAIVNPVSRQSKEDLSTRESMDPSTWTNMAPVARMGRAPSVLQTRIQVSISEKLRNQINSPPKIQLSKCPVATDLASQTVVIKRNHRTKSRLVTHREASIASKRPTIWKKSRVRSSCRISRINFSNTISISFHQTPTSILDYPPVNLYWAVL